MPPIRSLNLSDGIEITADGLPNYKLALANFPSSGTNAAREAVINELLKRAFEARWVFANYLAICAAKMGMTPTQARPLVIASLDSTRERVETITGTEYLVTTVMFVAVHIYSRNPWRYIVNCSDTPITGTWW